MSMPPFPTMECLTGLMQQIALSYTKTTLMGTMVFLMVMMVLKFSK